MPLDPVPNPSTPATPAAAQAAAPAPGSNLNPNPDPSKPPEHPSGTVTIPLEQLQAFTAIQTRLAKIEEENRVREAQAQQEQAAILAKKGEIENALDLLRKQSEKELAGARADKTMIEERAKRYAKDAEISRVLAGLPLVPGGAEQLTRLFQNEFQVEPQGDSFAVRTPQFQSVTDHVAILLGKAEYAHFLRAQNPTGGTGGVSPASQTAPTQAAQTAAPEAPKTLAEAVILHMKEMDKNRVSQDGRLNMGSSIGLHAMPRAARQA